MIFMDPSELRIVYDSIYPHCSPVGFSPTDKSHHCSLPCRLEPTDASQASVKPVLEREQESKARAERAS